MSAGEQEILDIAYSTAINAALKASTHVLQYWPNPFNPHFDKTKIMEIFEKNQGVGNYATIADTEAEDIIIKMIKENHILKDHDILAEESGGQSAESPYHWIIDPIDGTQNFRNGMTEFGISIGVVYDNDPVIGIIAMPGLEQIIVARKGQGAQLLDMERKQLLDLTAIEYTENLDKALIAYDMGYSNRMAQMHSGIERIVDNVGYTPIYASSSAANYRLALGYVGGYFHQVPTKYDIAGAALIITEAGGVVTNMKGNKIDWTAPTVSYLAARNSSIYQQLFKLLNN